MTRQEIKARAKEQLGREIFGENWLSAVLIILINTAIMAAGGALVGVGTVVALVIAGPLEYGITKAFLKQTRDGQKIEVGTLFDGFKDDFTGNFALGLLMTLFIALWSLLFVIPGIVKSYAYSMAFYIKNDHPDFTWKQCIDESQNMMRGHKMELFIQDLSFLGWMIVGELCLGVGGLWVSAYVSAARSQFYENLLTAPQNS